MLPWRLHRFTPRADDEIKSWWPRLSSPVTGDRRKELNSLVCCTFRMIWLEGNNRVFERTAAVESIVTLRIRTGFALWLLARTSGSVDDDVRHE